MRLSGAPRTAPLIDELSGLSWRRRTSAVMR